MALAFPLLQTEFSDLLRVRTVSWSLMWRQEMSEAAGETLAADLGPPLWEAAIETAPMPHAEADQLAAVVDALDGALQTFYLTNPKRPFPQSDPDGSILGAADVEILTVGADNKSLALEGLPNGYAITRGDMLAVDYGSPARRALFRFVGSGNASSGGETAELEVRPHIRPGLIAGAQAYLAKPAPKMVMVAGSVDVEQVTMLHSLLRFTARQTLRAG